MQDEITKTASTGADGYENGSVITVRPTEQIMTRQRLPNFVGISNATAGSRGLCMNMVIIPPGGEAEPHYHDGFETAIYLISGQVETLYGAGLRQSCINGPGDFIFIPPGVPHQPRNLSQTEAAYAIVSRNDAKEQESVVIYDPASE
jgi:uncharacterized RmlC-like cupin family protein